ncbi:Asp-tRNA(Asn)/Glu-tRNA(Gln) amidotransferase subunit GatC [bacterium]|nr:MAG: Asp-tRNA(Asn)/Glu-tRNA(Gln) amidotransferase subunit GatC [bacterium]
MSVSKEDVSYVADLARLNPSEAEKEQLQKDMNKILEYIDLLNQVDTDDVQPLEHVTELTAPLRKDLAKTPLDHELALKNAPDADTDYFRVPKVIE